MRFANVTGSGVADGSTPVVISEFIHEQFDPALSWADVDWLRSIWDGPIMLKGVGRVEDAVRASEVGVDAVVLSNHGGRQLDGAPATFSLLPAVADAIGGRTEIICDGGIRRGSDIVKAVAAGATAAMAGRAYLWGLAAAGELGVSRVLEWFAADMTRTMSLLGVTSVVAAGPVPARAPRLIRPVGLEDRHRGKEWGKGSRRASSGAREPSDLTQRCRAQPIGGNDPRNPGAIASDDRLRRPIRRGSGVIHHPP